MADVKRKPIKPMGRVDQEIINRIADAVDAERAADRELRKQVESVNSATNTVGIVRTINDSLVEQASAVADAKAAGYSQLVAEAALMQGRARAHQRRKEIYGAVGSGEVTAKEIRIKSDGKGSVQLYQNAARNGNVNRNRDTAAGAFLLRNVTASAAKTGITGKAISKGLAEVAESHTPLENEHAGWKAVENDIDDFDWS